MNLVQRAYLIRTETEKRQKVGIFWLLVLLFNKGVFFSLFVCELRILSKKGHPKTGKIYKFFN